MISTERMFTKLDECYSPVRQSLFNSTLRRKPDAKGGSTEFPEMALDSRRGGVGKRSGLPLMAVASRGVIQASFVLFNAAHVCFVLRGFLGNYPCHIASSAQEVADKPGLAISGLPDPCKCEPGGAARKNRVLLCSSLFVCCSNMSLSSF